ncbi:MAG: macro domain-containing protein [Candidatus Hodarchaeota archaeon]
MARALIGDLFKSRAQTLVNTVNCVGVMGKGIALEFKKRFPDMYKDYVSRCQKGEVKLGRPYLYKRAVPPWILNFPTKDHWRSLTKLDDIVNGLEYLFRHYKQWSITSLAVPPLGCGSGQLEWRIVGPTLYRSLERLDIPIELYAPYGTPHEELQPEFLEQAEPSTFAEYIKSGLHWINPAWIGLVDILRRIEEQPFHRPVGRTIFQKIVYVATEEGLPTGLQCRKGSYGPFCSALKSVITKLLNNGLMREERLGPMFAIKVGPTFKDAKKAYVDNLSKWELIVEKTADLFMRMDTKQTEVVTTVLFTARSMARAHDTDQPSERDILDEVMQWKRRHRPPLDEGEVALAVRNLAALGWIRPKASPDLPLPPKAILDI